MSNFMRNFVIEMEIANINLSLLRIRSFVDGARKIMKERYDGNFWKLNCGDSTCIITIKIRRKFFPLDEGKILSFHNNSFEVKIIKSSSLLGRFYLSILEKHSNLLQKTAQNI